MILDLLDILPNRIKGIPRFKAFLLGFVKKPGWRFAKLPEGIKIAINLNNYSEIPIWLGSYDNRIQKFLYSNLKPNSTFIDCGSNIGIWSLLACSYYKIYSGKVISCEANPALAKRLMETLSTNHLSHIWHIIDEAVSDHEGHLTLDIHDTTHEMSKIVVNDEDVVWGNPLKVKCTSLDSMTIDNNLIGLKIDVEGHEEYVLRGGENMLVQHKPWIVIEFNARYTGVQKLSNWNVHLFLINIGYISNYPENDTIQEDVCLDILYFNPYYHTNISWSQN